MLKKKYIIVLPYKKVAREIVKVKHVRYDYILCVTL